MIEFKAECGHTVRARDEDAGGVVRCSYCGRNAPVPDNVDSELDFLFREIEETGETDKGARRPRKRKRKRKAKLAGAARGGFDPFAVVLKLCYLAVLVIAVYLVVQKAVMPLVRGEKPIALFGGTSDKSTPRPVTTRRRSRDEPRSAGLVGNARIAGLYIASIPTGASAYIIEASRAPTTGRIASLPGVRHLTTDDAVSRLSDGEYVVEIALPWHDKRLSAYAEYVPFRRSIEKATDVECRRLLEEYFVPDGAVDVFVHAAAEQIYLVRQYRATVARDRSNGVQALFLPRIARTTGVGFTIEPLVARYAPAERRYDFDEELVFNELAYYGVQVTDRPLVVEALHRMGVIPYVTPDGATRLFNIGISDGMFATHVVREPR